MKIRVRSWLGGLLATAICLAAAIGALFIADRFLVSGRVPVPGLDLASAEKTIRTLDLNPWTGFHVQSNFHHLGDTPWETWPYKDFDLRTGPLGFFDLDVLNPTSKGRCIRRVALIGGSGAQGWGARTNADTIGRRLQVHLNENPSLAGLRVEVLNFAMGGSITYQNFIALNLYGHAFSPDLIVSYSGRNDTLIPESNWNDGFYQFNEIATLTEIVRRSSGTGTGFVAWLSDLFPAIMEATALGPSLRLLTDYSRTRDAFRQQHAARNGYDKMDAAEFLDRVVISRHEDALKSIKRDFGGIPIVLAWQAVLPGEVSTSGFAKVRPDFYEYAFDAMRAHLAGYMNDGWLFIDSHRYMAKFPTENTGTHLGNAGQDRVARLIADKIAPLIEGTRADCR